MYLMEIEEDRVGDIIFQELVWCYNNAEEPQYQHAARVLLEYYSTPDQLEQLRRGELDVD